MQLCNDFPHSGMADSLLEVVILVPVHDKLHAMLLLAGCLALAGQQAMGAGLLLWPYGLCFRKTPSSSPEPLVLLRHFPPRMGTLTMNMSQPGHSYMLPAATVSQCTTMQHGSWRLINI